MTSGGYRMGFAWRAGGQKAIVVPYQGQGNRHPPVQPGVRASARVLGGERLFRCRSGRQSTPHCRPKIFLPATGIFAVSTSPDTDSVM
jgi:hypothetical protein